MCQEAVENTIVQVEEYGSDIEDQFNPMEEDRTNNAIEDDGINSLQAGNNVTGYVLKNSARYNTEFYIKVFYFITSFFLILNLHFLLSKNTFST